VSAFVEYEGRLQFVIYELQPVLYKSPRARLKNGIARELVWTKQRNISRVNMPRWPSSRALHGAQMIAWTLAQPSERAPLGQGMRLLRQLPRTVRGATTTRASAKVAISLKGPSDDPSERNGRPSASAPRLMACLLAAAQILKSH
jgi:hypothetical protein